MNAPAHARSANPGHRFHNSLLALFAVAVVSATSLMAARPLPAPRPLALVAADAVVAEVAIDEAMLADIAVQATRDAIEISVQSPAEGFDADPAPAPKPRKHNRRSRQTLAMPYFSFAARS